MGEYLVLMAKKVKLGRPALPKHERRQVFTLRLSPAELAAIERAASDAGLTVSRWARAALLQRAGVTSS